MRRQGLQIKTKMRPAHSLQEKLGLSLWLFGKYFTVFFGLFNGSQLLKNTPAVNGAKSAGENSQNIRIVVRMLLGLPSNAATIRATNPIGLPVAVGKLRARRLPDNVLAWTNTHVMRSVSTRHTALRGLRWPWPKAAIHTERVCNRTFFDSQVVSPPRKREYDGLSLLVILRGS